jgi:hypothetical protein
MVAARLVFRRGVEIFLLAFLFRLQAFIVSPGGSPDRLLKVDILNVMGPSIAAAGLVWGLWRNRYALTLTYAGLAVAFAMTTPLVRVAAWVKVLPVWMQWYLQPAGDQAGFTLFPWVGFVFAGGAVGVIIAAARDPRTEGRVLLWLAAAGAGLAALGAYSASLPSIYRESSFWTSSPTYFAIRAAILMIALVATYWLSEIAAHLGIGARWLERLGRRSLFVYWIHVELVYGYATWPIRHELRLGEAAMAYVAFCFLIYGIVLVRDRLGAQWRSKGSAPSPLFSNP